MAAPQAVQDQAKRAEDLAAAQAPQHSETVQAAAEQSAPKNGAELENLQLKLARADERFTVLTGKYNAEVPRYAQELRGLKEEIAKLTRENEELKQKQAPQSSSILTPEKKTELEGLYGPEMVHAFETIASAAVQPLQKKFDEFKPVKEPEKPANHEPVRETRDDPSPDLAARYEGMLTQMVPTWRAQNDDQRFIAWLNLRDPTSGIPRMSMLQRHHDAMDAVHVAEIFKAFTEGREIGAAAPSTSRVSIEPGPGGGDQLPGDQSGKKVYTRTEIKTFYTECAQGKYAGDKAKEASRIEADIFAAQREGRIRND